MPWGYRLKRSVTFFRRPIASRPLGAGGVVFGRLLPSLLLSGCIGAGRLPDVILVTFDTTRADHLSAYGYDRPTSPRFDRLAREGVLFRRAWSAAPWTLPSHASIFTGQHPRTHGARFNEAAGEKMFGNRVSRLGDDATTLAERLRERGYATAAFAGGPWLSPEFGLLQGYETWFAGLRSGESLRARKPTKLRVNWPADDLTDRAIRWLKTVSRDRPVHLFVNYFDAHAPHTYRPQFGVEPAAAAKGKRKKRKKDVRARYDSEIGFMDHHFGRLLDALRELGRYDDALIIVVADHGESFGERGNYGHGPWLYEEVLRVPLAIRFPGGRDGGSEVDAVVSTVDILSWIAEEVGLTLPSDREGVAVGEREVAIFEAYRSAAFTRLAPHRYDRDMVGAVRWPWKLHVPSAGAPELYELASDPAERVNRAGDPAQSEMRELLDRALSRMPAPAAPVAPEGVDEALEGRLRTLGYVR